MFEERDIRIKRAEKIYTNICNERDIERETTEISTYIYVKIYIFLMSEIYI